MTRTVFHGGDVFDGTGQSPETADVAIEDGHIVEVGSDLDGDEGVDVAGKTVLPGLFDCHTHVMFSRFDYLALAQQPFSYQFYAAAENLGATLRAGITTIRDAWGADRGVQKAVEDGLVEGPRMHISIIMLSQTGGHADTWMPCGGMFEFITPHPGMPEWIVDGPEQMRRKVREVVRAGADVIKIAASGGVLSPADDPRHAHFRRDELDTAVAEARFAGLGVMAHCHSGEGIKNAVRAGVTSIEHGTFLDEEGIGLMLERGVFLVPTLLAAQGVIDAAEAGAGIPDAAVAKAREVVPVHREAVRAAVAAGVDIAMGTDSAVTPHGRNLDELALMEEAGMTTEAVLHAATGNAARLMGLDDELGTIAAGKCADLVVVDGDARRLGDIGQRVEQVWKDGRRAVG